MRKGEGNQEYGENFKQKQKKSEYNDTQNLNKHQQNNINLEIIIHHIEKNNLQKLKQFISQYDNISTLKIFFSYRFYCNQAELNQLISVLSKIQILYKLKIQLSSFREDLDIIKFAYEIIKHSSIQSFSLDQNSRIQSFNIRQNNEYGKNVVSQLEYMKNNGKYSALEDLFLSQNIFLRKLYLIVSQDKLNLQNEITFSNRLSKFQHLKYLKYCIKLNEVEYDQILSLNQVLSSIQNLEKLDLQINIGNYQYQQYEDYYNDHLLIDLKFKNEKDQQQIEYQKIKEIAKQCKSIENVNLKMHECCKDIQTQSKYNFSINLFKSILWQIQNAQILNIDIPIWIMEQFINEISHFQLLETLTFKTESYFLNEENSETLGIGLNKCKNLKRLQMNINLKLIQGKQNILMISNHLKQLPCQKNIIIQFNSYKQLRNIEINDKKVLIEETLDQMKEIIKLNNIYCLKFQISYYFEEIITLLKPISMLRCLQTITFSEFLNDIFSENKSQKKYKTWESIKQFYECQSGGGWCYSNEVYSLIKSINDNKDLKKANRLVNINLFNDKIPY